MEETKDPFTTFGGHEVDTESDPFAKFGGMEVKKKVSKNASESGGQPLKNGGTTDLNSLISTPQNNDTYTVITDHALKNNNLHQQSTPESSNTSAQSILDKLSPSERANILAFNKIALIKPKDELTAPTAEERAHQDFMQTNTGKALGAVAYLGSKATKGTLQVLKGAAHLVGGLSALPAGDATTDQAFNMLDKASDYGLTKADIANQESGKTGKALSALGMAAEFAPTVATGEALNAPKSLMYLQGIGQGKELADNLENNGTKLNPVAKEALIQGTGAVNLLLTDIFKGAKVSSSLQDKVTTGIAADALKESAGKDISIDSFKKLLENKAQDFASKFEGAPIEILKHYNETAKTFTKLNVGNFALHKLVDELNEKPVFNETLGDLAGNEQKALTQDAPIFSAIPAVGELTKLLPNSGYRNEVVDAVMKDPSPENIDQIKDKIYNHGFDESNPNKWSPEEMDATFQHVDKIADAARALPRDINENKRDKAVGLVLDRNELQDKLKSLQEAKKSLDPSIQDIPTAKEQYLTDKIEQANDKLRNIVKGSRTTYSKERDDKGQETGKFLKKTDGAVEEITPQRYDLENLERSVKAADRKPVDVPLENVETPLPVEEQPVVKENLTTEQNSPVEDVQPSPPEPVTITQESEQPIAAVEPALSTTEPSPVEEVKLIDDKPIKSEDITKRGGVEQPKAGDPLRSFAEKVRQGKINKLGGFRASTGFDGVWDGSLEVVAKSIEGGAKIADAIESGLNNIKQTDWYKSLSEKESFDEQYRNHLNNEYTEHEKTSPIKNATSEERAAEQGLKIEDTRNGKRGADIVDADAAKTISEGYDTPDLVHRILNEKHQASDTEVAILSKYADAKEKEIKDYDKELTDNGATMPKGDFNAILAKKEQALSDFQDVLQAARKTGTETARALAARRNAYNQEYSLANMVARKRESLGGEKLTKEQFDDINKRFDELEKARNDFEAKVKKLEEENAKLRANQNVKQTAAERLKRKSVKLEGIDTKKKQLVEDWRKELKKIRTSMSATVPYARELAATAPFVTKYLKYLAQEGVVELKDIVDRIHETFKEDLPDLTKRDVVDILAGNYDEQKPTRSKLTSDIQSLKTQAKLLAQIEDLENGIKSDNPNSNSARGKNEAVQRLRARLKELQSEDEPTPDEKDISAYKKRIQARIDGVQERLDNEDYEKPEKKIPLKLDQEALELRRKYDRLKSNFDIEVAKDQLRQRTKTQKFWDDFLNVAALPRALKASLDFSAVLRQGLFASVGHPTIALKAFKEMFGQTFSEKRYSDWLADIKHSDFYDLMQDSDLYISDKNDPKLLAREEEFTSNLGEKIPILGKAIAGSERAYTGYLNVLRTGVFADGAQRLIERGYTFEKNPEQFKALAKVVNVLTGRGDIPEFLGGKQPKFLSNSLFSPRFMAARIQTLYLWFDPRLPKEAKIMAAKDIGSTLALAGLVIGLAKINGLKVNTDPRSVQFLKVQDKEEHGTTYYDILGGLPQYVRFLAQQIKGEKIPANDRGVVSLTSKKPHTPTRLTESVNFLRGKAAPLVGIGANLLDGKDVLGQPYHLWPNVAQEFVPLPYSDITEAYKVGGIDNALKTFLPSQFGVGVSSYDPKAKKKK